MTKFWKSKFIFIVCLSVVFGLTLAGGSWAVVTVSNPQILDATDFTTPGAWQNNGFGECFYLLPGPVVPGDEEPVGPDFFSVSPGQYTPNTCFGAGIDVLFPENIDWRIFRGDPDSAAFAFTAAPTPADDIQEKAKQNPGCLAGGVLNGPRGTTWDDGDLFTGVGVVPPMASELKLDFNGRLTLAYYFVNGEAPVLGGTKFEECRTQEFILTVFPSVGGPVTRTGTVGEFSMGKYVVFELDGLEGETLLRFQTTPSNLDLCSPVLGTKCTTGNFPNCDYVPGENDVLSGVFLSNCQQPAIEIVKQVSLTGDEPFFDANTPQTAPVGDLGADATYRLIVTNVGNETLINAVITDPTLGLVDVPVLGGPLAPGDVRTITTSDAGFENLYFPDRCDSAGNKSNIARVDAAGQDTGTPVSDDDPANVNCAENPAIEILKQVSLTGGAPFFDADNPGDPDVPEGALGADATYRLIVRNTGDVALVDAVINDATLGLVDVPVPGGPLAPGGERVIDAGDLGFANLFFADRCDSTGNKMNIARVDAESEDTGEPVSDENPANVKCEDPQVELKKQVSLTGGAPFFDADNPGDPDVPSGALGADATYRLIVRNIGSETLINAVINDPTLGLVNVPVPGGPLAPGDERVITSGDTGFGNLFFEDRCDSAGNKSNIARVDAEGRDTNTPVSDDDPANVNCEEDPAIQILKQVSLTGGEPFFDADNPGDPDVPEGSLGADATYRLIVRNTGNVALVNAVINDATLNLVDVPVPDGPLAPGDERVITSGDTGFGNLFFEDRCDSAGNKLNIARVDAQSGDTGAPVEDEDPANVNCEDPQIEILKQVSLTGGAPFFDADTPETAPSGGFGADATYRLIVRNIGTETLINAVINDATLGLVNVPVPGGPLAPGDERVIDAGAAGFENLFFEDRCDSAGNKSNIARVDAEGEDTGTPVSDDDPANVKCEGGGEGCTPGYWKQSQHFDSWTDPYMPNTPFSDVFENAFPGMTLLDVLKQGGGGLKALGRHTVAALLNAASPGVSYDVSVNDVIGRFNAVFPGSKNNYNGLKNLFEEFNEQGCPLN